MKLFSFLLTLLFLTSCSEEVEQKPTTPLTISTSNGEIRFNVEVAQTPEELQKGLMYRTQMPLNNGMIFSIYPVRPTGMWMKNTKIALDMLFVAPDASISMIKENATPMSEDLIISRDPVRAVIELNAGQVKRYGIKVGDKVSHALLSNLTTLSDVPATQPAVISKGPNAPAAGPVIPKGPNAPAAGPVIPKGPNAPAAGPVIPKGPNAPAAGPVIPKGPNAPAAGPVIPKGPNAPAAGPVIPKGPNAPAAGPVIPKGPNAPAAGPVIPKGPNAPAAGPVKLPVPTP